MVLPPTSRVTVRILMLLSCGAGHLCYLLCTRCHESWQQPLKLGFMRHCVWMGKLRSREGKLTEVNCIAYSWGWRDPDPEVAAAASLQALCFSTVAA